MSDPSAAPHFHPGAAPPHGVAASALPMSDADPSVAVPTQGEAGAGGVSGTVRVRVTRSATFLLGGFPIASAPVACGEDCATLPVVFPPSFGPARQTWRAQGGNPKLLRGNGELELPEEWTTQPPPAAAAPAVGADGAPLPPAPVDSEGNPLPAAIAPDYDIFTDALFLDDLPSSSLPHAPAPAASDSDDDSELDDDALSAPASKRARGGSAAAAKGGAPGRGGRRRGSGPGGISAVKARQMSAYGEPGDDGGSGGENGGAGEGMEDDDGGDGNDDDDDDDDSDEDDDDDDDDDDTNDISRRPASTAALTSRQRAALGHADVDLYELPPLAGRPTSSASAASAGGAGGAAAQQRRAELAEKRRAYAIAQDEEAKRQVIERLLYKTSKNEGKKRGRPKRRSTITGAGAGTGGIGGRGRGAGPARGGKLAAAVDTNKILLTASDGQAAAVLARPAPITVDLADAQGAGAGADKGEGEGEGEVIDLVGKTGGESALVRKSPPAPLKSSSKTSAPASTADTVSAAAAGVLLALPLLKPMPVWVLATKPPAPSAATAAAAAATAAVAAAAAAAAVPAGV